VPHLLLTLLMMSAVSCSLLWILLRHHTVGVLLVLAVHALDTVASQNAALVLGFHVYPADVVSVCAAGVAVSRLLVHGVPKRAGLMPLLGLGALTLCSTLRGIGSFGLQTAVNDVRLSFWYLLAAALYTATMPAGVPVERAVRRAWGATAVAYAGLCVIGWARHGLHAVTYRATVGGVVIDPRPVPAAAALILAQTAILLMFAPPDQGRRQSGVPTRIRQRALSLLLLVFVLLLQHRTVWVVTVAMALTGWMLGARGRERVLSTVVLVLSTALTVLAYQFGVFSTVGTMLATSAEEVQDSNSTFAWRVTGWQQLLTVPRSLLEWLSGLPFGSGYGRLIGGHLVTVGPHNYYVHVLLRLGTLGLLLLVVLYVLTWRRLGPASWGVPLRALLVGQLVFFITYPASSPQGILAGLCVWCVHARVGSDESRRKAPENPPVRIPASAQHAVGRLPVTHLAPRVGR
jgi:hypothetical protein